MTTGWDKSKCPRYSAVTMDELRKQYETMYRCMIGKDIAGLSELLDEAFVLVHMTGLRQGKAAYLGAIRNGTLNYYTAEHNRVSVEVNGDTARIIGQSRVSAAVFGGGRHTWRLRQTICLTQKDGKWLMTEAVASTY